MLLWNGGVCSGVEECLMIGRSSLRASPEPCGHYCLGFPFSRICPSNGLAALPRSPPPCQEVPLLRFAESSERDLIDRRCLGMRATQRNATPPARHRKRPGKADQASALAFAGRLRDCLNPQSSIAKSIFSSHGFRETAFNWEADEQTAFISTQRAESSQTLGDFFDMPQVCADPMNHVRLKAWI
jgi:hypothetical protein